MLPNGLLVKQLKHPTLPVQINGVHINTCTNGVQVLMRCCCCVVPPPNSQAVIKEQRVHRAEAVMDEDLLIQQNKGCAADHVAAAC